MATTAWPYIYQGWAYTGLGNQALADLNKAAQLNPNNPYVYQMRAWAHNVLGNKQKALEDFDRSLSLAPNNSWTHWNIAVYYALSGEKEKSLAALRSAIRINGTLKQRAKTDKNFQSLWNDVDFKKLVE
jgi:tetratricopeptide (TPR) repeat protein